MLRDYAEGAGAVFLAVLLLGAFVLVSGTSFGLVRENCARAGKPAAAGTEGRWTWVLWPPLTLANLDPPGRCVRNAPLREALDAARLWELPSPAAQVREHTRDQRRDRR